MIDEEKIRQRAYELWQQSGQPEGAEEEHWRQAREELEAQQPPAEANTLGSDSDFESQVDADFESDVVPTDLPEPAGQQGS